ncbi:MAG: efflux transporter periplasmic adaptor subunit [Planctomyces sp.]|nr:efflux transporter periplasmic adaptor subunit [Planctomyces sp.]
MITEAPVSPPPEPPLTRHRTSPVEEQPPGDGTAAQVPESHHQSAVESLAKQSAGRGWLVTFLVVAVLGGGAWFFRENWWPAVASIIGGKGPVAKRPARVVPVATTDVRQQDMKLYLNGLGTVTPFKTVTVRARVEGELLNVAFTEGQMVNEGDLLAEIDKRPFELQRDQALGQLARDEATLASAQYTLDRYEQLLKDKIIPIQQVQEQRALARQTEGVIQSDRAAIANAELQIAYCRITAPVSGRIGLRLVDLGNIVRANDPNGLAVINQVRPITIVFTISQDDIPRVQKRIREGKDLTVEAYDRELTTKLATGKLLAADNQVDSATGTLRLKAIVEEDADRLFPNQFVNTRLLVEQLPGAITIPTAAVQRGPKGTFVYVVGPESKVDVRLIEVGPSEGPDTIVEKGLEVGEVVVTEGLDKLQPGATVSTRDPKETNGKEMNGKGAGQSRMAD